MQTLAMRAFRASEQDVLSVSSCIRLIGTVVPACNGPDDQSSKLRSRLWQRRIMLRAPLLIPLVVPPLLAVSFLATMENDQRVIDGYEMGGDARALNDECVRLTPDARWAEGSVWAKEMLDLSRPFEVTVDLRFGERDALGADGIVFALSPIRATGWRGEGMGYAGLRRSIGIELDTYQNWREGDPVEDHLGLLLNGSPYHGDIAPVALPNLEDGRSHTLHVEWAPAADELRVHLDGVQRANYPGGTLRQVLDTDAKVSWGLTAGTGARATRTTFVLATNEGKPVDSPQPAAVDRFRLGRAFVSKNPNTGPTEATTNGIFGSKPRLPPNHRVPYSAATK